MSKLEKDEDKVQEKIGYKFNNIDLLYQAFTRRSYSAEEFGGENNEVLEFIGDSVLNFYVTKIISDRFGFMKSESKYYDEHNDYDVYCIIANKNEADFNELRKQIVSNNNLSKQIDQLGFAKYLFMSDSDWDNEVYKQEKVKADLSEAIIGAVAIDSNYDSNKIQNVLFSMLNIDKFFKKINKEEKRPDKFKIEYAIDTVNKLYQRHIFSKPEYSLHFNPRKKLPWECYCYISNKHIEWTSYCDSKKEAKRYAAYLVLCDYYNLPDEFNKK